MITATLTTTEGSIILNGHSSIPKGSFSISGTSDGKVTIKAPNGVQWNLELAGTTLDGEDFEDLESLVEALSAFGSNALSESYLKGLDGYDEEATQTLTNTSGVFSWVTAE